MNGKAAEVFPTLMSQNEFSGRGKRTVSFAHMSGYWFKHQGREPYRSENVARKTKQGFSCTTLSVRNLHEHGDLFLRYLKARRDVFIVEKGWHLPEADGMEFDQYDIPLARWIVVHDKEAILAGIRLLPTTSQCGRHSYMLRDAQLGLLGDIPDDILYDEAPVAHHIWEATRLFVSEKVDADRRLSVQKALMQEMSKAARAVGATEVIGIVPAVFRRWLSRIDLAATAIGPTKVIDGDRVQAALMMVSQQDVGADPGEKDQNIAHSIRAA
ncbi:acyl-homoserine-lactone synthase [Maritimibacter alexandrii]|uniref:acyl-homoserine-lactone synthase n=1 Tax=Maritimibacter alexandrii TaxID=2570355 RepID=UPI001F41C2AE|nr:acyl-homoserine-lactone synthase [Maritimibacter alexandrii]